MGTGAWVEIVNEGREYVTRSATEDQWDCDDTSWDHSIEGIRQANHGDLTLGFDLVEGQTYYLLYGLYNTGCSFCHTEGVIEYIGLYQDEKVAKENLERINRHHEVDQKINGKGEYWGTNMSPKETKRLAKKHSPYSVELITEDGEEYQVSVPWHGYFESLTGVDIEPVQVL